MFAVLASSVQGAGGISRVDAGAHDALYAFIGPRESLIAGVTFFGNNATIVTLVVLVALGLVLAKRIGLAVRVVFASGLGGILVVTLKQIFQRARPIEQLLPAGGFSFPSGHAFAATVFYGMMVVLVWRLTDRRWARALAALLGPLVILAVGLSRVYLNVHYLSDVLAGWSIGLAWLVASLLLIDTIEYRARAKR
ncbi:MAG: phosphatase PAP2 family protein [Bacteroidota bacterium]